jgi:3-polyprenyl-4-hydroxybenzoate decarboxylase
MRIIVAMTWATGSAHGVGLLAALRQLFAQVTLLKETRRSAFEFASAASIAHARDNHGAAILRHIDELPSIPNERGPFPREM